MPSYLCSEIFPDMPLILLFAKFVFDQFAHRFHSLDLVRAFGDHLNHGPLRRGEEQDSENVLRVHRPRRRVPAYPGPGQVGQVLRIDTRLNARKHYVAAERVRQLDQLGRRPRVQPQTIGDLESETLHLSHWRAGERESGRMGEREGMKLHLVVSRSLALSLPRSPLPATCSA